MNFDDLHPVIEAASRIFFQLFQLKIRPLKYFYTHSKDYKHPILCEVTGMIHFTNGIKGALMLYLPQSLAKSLIQNILPDSLKEDEDLDPKIISDGVGELTNLICGNSKNGLSQRGKKIEISLPHVIFGASYQIGMSRDTIGIASLVDTDLGKFIIELNIKRETS